MARLLVQMPGKEPLVFELVKPRVTIGRGENNDLVLRDGNVSRFHATLELAPEGCRIKDENSRNGLFIGDRQCREAPLKDGATVRLGDTVLRLEEASAAWSGTTVLERAAATELIGAEERGFTKASEALRQLAWAPPAAGDAAELLTKLHAAERRAVLFEAVSHARRLFQEAAGAEQVLEMIPNLVFSATQAERVVVMLWDSDKDCLIPAAIHTPGGQAPKDTDLALSSTLLKPVLESRRAVLVRDANADPNLSTRASVALSGLRSAVCVPMAVRDRLYGLVYADNRHMPLVFDEQDLELVSILGREGAMALHTARMHEEHRQVELTRQAYRRFLPEHLVERLVSEPDAVRLGGVRQYVTALFADLRGFTALAEQLPPEEAMTLLNAFFAEMTSVVFRHSGMLDKYLGDGLLAVFGAPLADPSDPLRAAECALAMQEQLDELTLEWQARGLPTIPMGIGVNSGEAIVGNIGSALHMEYTVIGDTVNVAARLTQHAGPGEILLGENTWRYVCDHLEADRLPPLQLKGKRQPANAYRLRREAAAAGSGPARPAA